MTHAGLFHADEIAGYAITKLRFPDAVLRRVTDLKKLEEEIQNWDDMGYEVIVADIGRKYDPKKGWYDHHQGAIRRGWRGKGIQFATAGMIWQEWGWEYIMKSMPDIDNDTCYAIADDIDARIIQGLDAHDADAAYKVSAFCSGTEYTENGYEISEGTETVPVHVVTMPIIISSFNAENPGDHNAQSANFREAADFVERFLKAEIRRSYQKISAETEVKASRRHANVLFLEKYVPWLEVVCRDMPEIEYVIYPSVHPGSTYGMQAVPVDPGSRQSKRPIERKGGFNGFIHEGKFFAGADSIEELVKLAEAQQ